MSEDPGEPYPPVAQFMPHGPPIRALDELLQWESGHAVCRLRIKETMPFVKDGAVATVAFVEYLAQAVAVCLGYEAYVGGEGVRVGMLVGIRKMTLHQPTVPVGTDVIVEVERLRGSEDVSTFRGVARVGETEIATAQMTLFHAERPPE
jgi:predicted hotdog family 3-hydroxylacyl-ACP dehydratase